MYLTLVEIAPPSQAVRFVIVGCLHAPGVACLLLAAARRRLVAALVASGYMAASTLWLLATPPGATLAELATVLAGGAVLCVVVLDTSDVSHRKLSSLKMLAGALTQASVCEYRVFPWPVAPPVPDAMFLCGLVVAPSVAFALCRRDARVRRHAIAAHALLTTATLAARFYSSLDDAVPLLGRGLYVACTWLGLLVATSAAVVTARQGRLDAAHSTSDECGRAVADNAVAGKSPHSFQTGRLDA